LLCKVANPTQCCLSLTIDVDVLTRTEEGCGELKKRTADRKLIHIVHADASYVNLWKGLLEITF